MTLRNAGFPLVRLSTPGPLRLKTKRTTPSLPQCFCFGCAAKDGNAQKYRKFFFQLLSVRSAEIPILVLDGHRTTLPEFKCADHSMFHPIRIVRSVKNSPRFIYLLLADHARRPIQNNELLPNAEVRGKPAKIGFMYERRICRGDYLFRVEHRL